MSWSSAQASRWQTSLTLKAIFVSPIIICCLRSSCFDSKCLSAACQALRLCFFFACLSEGFFRCHFGSLIWWSTHLPFIRSSFTHPFSQLVIHPSNIYFLLWLTDCWLTDCWWTDCWLIDYWLFDWLLAWFSFACFPSFLQVSNKSVVCVQIHSAPFFGTGFKDCPMTQVARLRVFCLRDSAQLEQFCSHESAPLVSPADPITSLHDTLLACLLLHFFK